MKIEFDYDIFREWYELNNMSRNRVIKVLGQRDPNKVGRWLTGQVIGTEDLIGLCNHYDLQITDFLIISDEDDGSRIKTAVPDKMKERRKAAKNNWSANVPTQGTTPTDDFKTSTPSLNADELALAQQSIMYEKRINTLLTAHSLEIKEKDAYMRQQLRERADIIGALQNTISTLSKEIDTKQDSIKTLQDTITTLQQTIQQQQQTIASYDDIIRKQKKKPSQSSPFFSGQATMAQDGGGAISAATPPNND